MARIGRLDFAAFVEARKRERAGAGAVDGRAYAYISDRTTLATFQRIKPVELAVEAAVRMFKAFGKGELLGRAVKVGPRQFGRVHRVGESCGRILGLPAPTIYIVNSPVLNAGTYGTLDDAFIMVHSALVDHMTDEELHSVIGHEMGHVHNNHVVYLTALHYLSHMAGAFVRWIVTPALLALRAWSRRAEITSDRAAMLCTRDLRASERALAKLALGSTKLYEELDLDVFVEQAEEGRGSVGRFAEVFSTHPWLPKRVLAMRVFAQSDLYRRHAAIGEGGLSMEEVDEKVHGIIKIVGV